jgi:hypothetical protein
MAPEDPLHQYDSVATLMPSSSATTSRLARSPFRRFAYATTARRSSSGYRPRFADRHLSSCFFKSIASMARMVASSPIARHDGPRRGLTIVLVRREHEFVVVAVHHQRRKPGYWKPRLGKVQP